MVKSKYGQQCGPWTTCLLFPWITWRLWLRVPMSCYMHICCSRSNGHILNMIIFSQRYDFTNKGSSSNVGLAYVSTMCSDQSVSVVEDHFDFTVLTSAAHELGHGYSIKNINNRPNFNFDVQIKNFYGLKIRWYFLKTVNVYKILTPILHTCDHFSLKADNRFFCFLSFILY